jgi:hypothetical protein
MPNNKTPAKGSIKSPDGRRVRYSKERGGSRSNIVKVSSTGSRRVKTSRSTGSRRKSTTRSTGSRRVSTTRSTSSARARKPRKVRGR